MVMFFAEFITCDAAIKYLKIPTNTKNFTVNLNKAIAKFYKDKTKYTENEQLVFKVKQLIARIHSIETNIDHFYESLPLQKKCADKNQQGLVSLLCFLWPILFVSLIFLVFLRDTTSKAYSMRS